jgi:hypothetical protein
VLLIIDMGNLKSPTLTPRASHNPMPGHPSEKPGWLWWTACTLYPLSLKGGQIVGRTTSKAEHPIERPLTPSDILATAYRVMGIDQTLAFRDHAGRPIPILDEGKPIEEIL